MNSKKRYEEAQVSYQKLMESYSFDCTCDVGFSPKYLELREFPADRWFRECWADVENFPIYCVSNFGRVLSDRKDPPHVLRPQLGHDGYLKVKLNYEGKTKNFRIHRLVAENFVSNPDNKPFVDHKDGNKFNNYAGNLRWVTAEENAQYYQERRRALGLPAHPPKPPLPTSDLVFIQKSEVYTTSLKVAEVFGKLHKNILQVIEIELATLRELESKSIELKIKPNENSLKSVRNIAVPPNELKIKPVENSLKDIIDSNFEGNKIDRAFIKGTYKDSIGRTLPMYYLNRDGFFQVALGFTGKEASKLRWNFIQEFNRMEAALLQR